VADFKTWLAKPNNKHIIDFYASEEALVVSILDYFIAGLEDGDNCIIIAKPIHVRMLDKAMTKFQIHIQEQFREDCRLLNAQSVMDQFIVDGLPNKKMFFKVMNTIFLRADKAGKPVRVYSEMVATLLEENNPDGAIQLEALWRELDKVNAFSLYSAYPDKSHGVSGGDLHDMIKSYYDFSFSSHTNV